MNVKERIQYGMMLMILTRVGTLFFLAVPIALLFNAFNPKEGDGLEGALGGIFYSVVITHVIGILMYVGLFAMIWKYA